MTQAAFSLPGTLGPSLREGGEEKALQLLLTLWTVLTMDPCYTSKDRKPLTRLKEQQKLQGPTQGQVKINLPGMREGEKKNKQVLI